MSLETVRGVVHLRAPFYDDFRRLLLIGVASFTTVPPIEPYGLSLAANFICDSFVITNFVKVDSHILFCSAPLSWFGRACIKHWSLAGEQPFFLVGVRSLYIGRQRH